ncbi:MAG: HD family phosphohydrolase, partial [Fusobacteriaceae bacterium]
AAVRSMDEKTQVTIEAMVEKIINSKIEDAQLSEADLTFREIEQIKNSFVNTLVSMHHARMKYPGQK